MFSRLSAALVAKTKVTAILAASLAAGSVGGAVALSHVAPTANQITRTADSTPTAGDPTTDPESSDAQGAGTSGTGISSTGGTVDPESGNAQGTGTTGTVDPESGAAQATPTVTPAPCPTDVTNHGSYVSSVAHSAPKGKNADHGGQVSAAAQSDCGKPAGATAGDSQPDPTESGTPQPGDTTSGDATTHGQSATHAHGRSGHVDVQPTTAPATGDTTTATTTGNGHGQGGGHGGGHGHGGGNGHGGH